MEALKEVLEKNKQKYIDRLSELVAIDTHDLGHGIDGGLEKQGQDYMAELFRKMGAEVTLDSMKEEDIEKCFSLYQETWGISRRTDTMSTLNLTEKSPVKP